MDTLIQIEPEVYEKVPKVFGRTQETLKEDVGIIREWLKTQPHLPELMDDVSIRNFLILNKCSIEKTKQKIDMYYTVRSLLPDIYEKANPKTPEFQAMMEALGYHVLPKLTPEMYRVFIRRFRDIKLYESLETTLEAGLAFSIFEVRLKEDYMFGDVMISDIKGLTMGTMAKWHLFPSAFLSLKSVCSAVKEFIANVWLLQKVYSMRIKAVYVVNAPPFVETFMTLLKTVIKPKLFARIHVSTDDTILSKVIPLDVLPKDYGGNEKSIDELQALWVEKFKQHQDRFDKLDTMRVKEELRPKTLTNDEFLGFHGNFKKLTVD